MDATQQTPAAGAEMTRARRHAGTGPVPPHAESPATRTLDDPAYLRRLAIQSLTAGRADRAVALLEQAAALSPGSAVIHNELGNAFRAAGRLDVALIHYRRAVQLRPDVLAIHSNVAATLMARSASIKAAAYAREVASGATSSVQKLVALGTALLENRLVAEAEACYRSALEVEPDRFDALNNLGTALWHQHDLEAAESYYRRALAVRPEDTGALSNLANIFWEQGRVDEAEHLYRQSLARQPESGEAHMNLAVVLSGKGLFDEALSKMREAVARLPGSVPAHVNLASVLSRQGKIDEAIASYEHAIQVDSGYAEAHRDLGMALLSQGDYARGWSEYEWRWYCRGKHPAPFIQPVWDGSDLTGRTILLHTEQGFGDALQFVRFASVAKERGGTVVLLGPGPILELLSRCPGIDHVVAPGSDLPDFDVHAPLLSLPRILKTTLATVPAEVPYLFADPERVAHWTARFRQEPGFTIGVAWQGNPRYGMDRIRSYPLERLAPLAQVPGARLVSLQKGHGIEQLQDLGDRFPVELLGGPEGEELGDFLETAAIISSLDLIVSPDVAVAHLAGALGKRTWLALPAVAEWRWLSDREDSVWYPTARLFRQARSGEWDSVFERMAECLREELALSPRRS
jgi:Flp pilus assembly protein TadD